MSSVYHRQGAPGFPSDTCSFLVYSLSRTKEASRHVKPRQIANINYFHLAASVYHPIAWWNVRSCSMIAWWNVRSCSIDVVLHCIDFLHFCFISGFIYIYMLFINSFWLLCLICAVVVTWAGCFQDGLKTSNCLWCPSSIISISPLLLSSLFSSLSLSLSLSLSSLFSSLFFLFSFSLRSKSQPPAWSKSRGEGGGRFRNKF